MGREEIPHLVIWEPNGLTKDKIMNKLQNDDEQSGIRSADLPLVDIKNVLNQHLFTSDDTETWNCAAIDPTAEALLVLIREHQIKLGRENDLAFGEIERGYKWTIMQLKAENGWLRGANEALKSDGDE